MNRSELTLAFTPSTEAAAVEWVVSPAPVAYDTAVSLMDLRVEAISRAEAAECVWLLEHPPLYTAGTSARASDLLDPAFPVFQAGRGGQYTYHGPGQRVAYVMLDLKRRKPDLRAFVATLESWVIATLADLGIDGERREDRVGVWVRRPDLGEGREDKIAALGIRLRRWISLHGISINVAPDLAHFSSIVPCGIADPRFGVTSLRELGLAADLPTVDRSLRRNFERLFGPTVDAKSSVRPAQSTWSEGTNRAWGPAR